MKKIFKNINSNKILNYYQLNKFNYQTSKQLPFIKKIVLNFDQKSTEFKPIAAARLALEMLFYQKSIITKVKQSNALYKIKKGQPIGSKLTINNKIKTIENLKIILDILFLFENNYKLKVKKKNTCNLITFNIFEIYNYKKLENYYLLLNKLKKLSISFIIFSNNKNYKEIKYFLNAQNQGSFFSIYNSIGRV